MHLNVHLLLEQSAQLNTRHQEQTKRRFFKKVSTNLYCFTLFLTHPHTLTLRRPIPKKLVNPKGGSKRFLCLHLKSFFVVARTLAHARPE